MKINSTHYLSLLCLISLIGFISCEKDLQVAAEKNPSLGLSPANAIKTPTDLQNLLNSCYDDCANMMNGQYQIAADLLGDDIAAPVNKDPFRTGIYKHTIDQFNGFVGQIFPQPYYTIYRANTMDLYYGNVASLTAAEKQRMQGEAAFLRAMCHYELVKIFAQPYGYSSDNTHLGVMLRVRAKNEAIPRSTVEQTYQLIISDLQSAISKLPVSNDVYANQRAAKALLSKVYFSMGKYSDALPLLTDVINNGGYTLSDSLNRFNRNETASEIIFGFVSGNNGYESGTRAAEFKGQYKSDLNAPTMNKPNLVFSPEMYNLLKDTNDRRSRMINVFSAGTPEEVASTTKFNTQLSYASPYLTLTDMVLMRAEILAIQGDGVNALAEITKIINRAYIDPSIPLANINNPSILENIRNQRRIEMVCEGDRIHQLKRIGADVNRGIGSVAPKVRGVDWNCNGMIYQFPSSCGTSSLFVFNPLTVCN